MLDVYLGILILLLISGLLFVAGLWIGKHVKPRTAVLLFMLTVFFLLAYQKFAADQLWLARILPFSNLVVIGNFFPPLVALAASFSLTALPKGVVRRSLLLIPFLALSWVGLVRTVFGAPPELGDRWIRDVCMQTSDASCSAAAAATLLHAAPYHIESSEEEMARLCLTHSSGSRADGTTMHGLYRGLKLKTAGTPWKPVPFHQALDELQKNFPGPVILTVELQVGDPRAANYPGWDPGLRHSVVLFRFLPDGRALMGDPDAELGRERWSLEDLSVLWHGDGIKLVRR
ncbi:MAG TPA: hypothetical protein VH370_07100 [Humisphaera sp.]|jgi:hypothetical protein|nr:hypothetical protein [Humisphaera sp.]